MHRFFTTMALLRKAKPLGLLLLAILSCNYSSLHTQQRLPDPGLAYPDLMDSIEQQRLHLKDSFAKGKLSLKQAGVLLDSILACRLFPHWKGTAWDFNGHTDSPTKGYIACGYLVSTLLKHSGFNLNRYKLARAPAATAGNVLLGKGKLKVLPADAEKLRKKMLNQYKPGLYFLGLDFHEAFLWLDTNELYILHSNYLNRLGVVKEKVTESIAFQQSSRVWLAPIGGDSALVKKWLYGTRIN